MSYKKDKKFALPILKRLFEFSHMDSFGLSPAIDYLEFSENSSWNESIKGTIYLQIESRWTLLDSLPEILPNSEDDLPDLKEEERTGLLTSLKDIEIVGVELGSKQPHLILTFENDKVLLVNGVNNFECWQAGVRNVPKESCEIIACPGESLAVWEPKTFSY